jgi:hypothetical protein
MYVVVFSVGLEWLKVEPRWGGPATRTLNTAKAKRICIIAPATLGLRGELFLAAGSLPLSVSVAI